MADFTSPGPGEWALDRSHFPGGTTPISQWLMTESMSRGMERVFGEIGVPASRIDAAFVRGFMYTRLRPLIGADRPARRLPPLAVLKLVTRLHPAFRSRAKLAAITLRDRPSLAVARRWESELRPQLRATNRRFQAIDPTGLDDAALDAHVSALLDHARDTFELHFFLHGHDLGPLARYLHACIGWGIDPDAAVGALAGASPSTSRPLETLCALRRIVEASGTSPRSLGEVRAVSAQAAHLLDEYLADHGGLLATGYDLTALTLAELPALVLDSICSAAPPSSCDHEAIAATLRVQVPEPARADFDRFLADARAVMDMRDDNGPLTAQWPAGLLRRALLAAGARLAARGALLDAEHVFDLTPTEARAALTGTLPSATELAGRAEQRTADAALTPPARLGDPEPAPPPDVLPGPLAETVSMVQVALTHLGMDGADTSDRMVGVGVGRQAYTGRARTAATADEAIEKLEPGDVLVVRATSPAFNAVLAIAGAVVTANGGALSHAAVLARELGIPAVVGAGGALAIPDGSLVEVDPVTGAVRVVEPA